MTFQETEAILLSTKTFNRLLRLVLIATLFACYVGVLQVINWFTESQKYDVQFSIS